MLQASSWCRGDGPEALTGSLSRIRRQTIADKLQLIILARAEHCEGIENLRPNEFADFTVIAGDLSTSARARAEAVQKAAAPIVIFAEDHAFVESDYWAERLVSGHSEAVVATGPVMRNANPQSAASWATFLIEYGAWAGRVKAGPAATIPGHNSSYRRDVLLSYGDRLPDLLEMEWVIQNDLRAKGYQLHLDPSVKVNHLNYALLWPSMRLHFTFGRVFADSRSQEWSKTQRVLFALAAPGIFLKRLAMIAFTCFTSNLTLTFFRALPMLILFLMLSATGEAIGYLFGAGERELELAELEYSRWRNVLPNEADLQMKPIR